MSWYILIFIYLENLQLDSLTPAITINNNSIFTSGTSFISRSDNDLMGNLGSNYNIGQIWPSANPDYIGTWKPVMPTFTLSNISNTISIGRKRKYFTL